MWRVDNRLPSRRTRHRRENDILYVSPQPLSRKGMPYDAHRDATNSGSVEENFSTNYLVLPAALSSHRTSLWVFPRRFHKGPVLTLCDFIWLLKRFVEFAYRFWPIPCQTFVECLAVRITIIQTFNSERSQSLAGFTPLRDIGEIG